MIAHPVGQPIARPMGRSHGPVSGGGWPLDAFMAAQSDGLFNRFTLSDRLFQENTGPTPADDPGEVIGLALSQRAWDGNTLAQVLAAATELTPNGTFDADVSNWTSTSAATVTWEAGRAKVVTTNANNGIYRTVPTVVGRFYRASASFALGGGFANVRAGTSFTDASNDSPPVSNGEAATIFRAAGASSTVYARIASVGTHYVDDISVKEVSGKHGVQPTLSFRPKFQTTGAAFDGVDDNLLTNYTAGAGANFIVAKVTVPPDIGGGTRVIAGASDTGFTAMVHLGFDGSTGRLRRAAAGSSTVGSVDRRGSTVVVAISWDSLTNKIRCFDGDALIEDGSYTGNITQAQALVVGGVNNAGALGAPWQGLLHSIVAGREFLDLAKFKQIASKL